MTKRYLSLVLVEVPDNTEHNPYQHWFNCVSIEKVDIKNGVLELTFSDGSIRAFSQNYAGDILINCSELIEKLFEINGFNLDVLINEGYPEESTMKIIVSQTRQIRQYEPRRIEVHIDTKEEGYIGDWENYVKEITLSLDRILYPENYEQKEEKPRPYEEDF